MSKLRQAAQQAPGSKNCMQCAAAYMLGVPLADVPDFEKAGADAWESFEAFFSERGFTAELFPPSAEIVGDYLASGDTERGTSHMVVMRGGELLHDPHPSNAGLTSIQAVWLIVRRAGPQPNHPAPQHLPGQPVPGVVIRDGQVTLLAERHIRRTDLRLCVMPPVSTEGAQK